jgi:beta-galactosidase
MHKHPIKAAPLTPRLPAFYFGGDYNPEQWTPAFGYEDETIWREDIRLMRLANVNVATVGVFSWVSLQPAEHTFTFGWLDRVMDLLAENGIFACLGTGTAAQPAWLSAAYPDVLPVDEQGLRRGHGRRQNYCPTSPDFRRLSQGLTRHLAERYRNHLALLIWHVSNEYGPRCYCERCAARFRDWLQARYGSLEEVNSRWTISLGHLTSM